MIAPVNRLERIAKNSWNLDKALPTLPLSIVVETGNTLNLNPQFFLKRFRFPDKVVLHKVCKAETTFTSCERTIIWSVSPAALRCPLPTREVRSCNGSTDHWEKDGRETWTFGKATTLSV